ncbi:MAG: 50S ribosomal protein L21 [Caldilineaceae bacterium]|nr:50S ribosomal protein L21 [Caldilineaceae bacterium]
MYAVVRTGGKQYRVAPGDILEVEKLTGEVGESVVLDDVLMVSSDDGVMIGQPRVEGASVTARITGQHRGEKILVFRYRPKKRVRVRRGHRQYLTRLQIHKISGEDFEFVEEAEEAAVVEAVAAVEDGIEAEDGAETAEPEIVEDDEADAAFAMLKETVAKAGLVVDETVSATGEVVEETVTEAGDVLDDAAEEAGNVVEDAVEKAGDFVEDTIAKADDVVDDTVEEAGDVVEDTIAKAGDVVEDAVEKVGDVVEDTIAKAGDVLDDTVEMAGDVVEDTVAKAGEVLDDVADSLKSIPFVGRGRKSGDDAVEDEADKDDKKEE